MYQPFNPGKIACFNITEDIFFYGPNFTHCLYMEITLGYRGSYRVWEGEGENERGSERERERERESEDREREREFMVLENKKK